LYAQENTLFDFKEIKECIALLHQAMESTCDAGVILQRCWPPPPWWDSYAP
jgi:hypothetical protein